MKVQGQAMAVKLLMEVPVRATVGDQVAVMVAQATGQAVKVAGEDPTADGDHHSEDMDLQVDLAENLPGVEVMESGPKVEVLKNKEILV